MADMGTNPQELFEKSGISAEEQKEVLERIEQVATENRIKVGPELFSLKNVRSGFLFPLLVDGIAVALIVIAVLALVLLFRHSQNTMVSTSGEYATVEGRLLRALQQESQQRLLDKDQQIASVKAQLAEVQRQRQALTANMEGKIKAREEEYRQKIQQELAAERQRLLGQGVASDTLAGMLATYEAERKAFYDRQLAAYRQQLEGERAAVERQLNQLQSEYQAQVQTLQQERSQLVQQYQQREATLQTQLEQRTRVLDVARVEAIQNLAAAQTRIQELSRQQQQTSVVQDQILGQFEQIRSSLQKNDVTAALSGIESLRSYLNDNKVLSIAEISRQREMDLFLLDSLQRLVQNQQRSDKSISNLSDDLVLLSRLRDTASRAEQAQASGNTALADQLYQSLIAYMPSIADAHKTLIVEARDKALAAAADTLKASQQERRDRFEALSTQAASAVHRGDYAVAYDEYRKALGLDPAVGETGTKTASELARLGFLLSAYVSQPGSNPSALAAIRESGIDKASQDAAFVEQTRKVTDAKQQDLLNRQQELTAEIKRLNTERTAMEQANAERIASLQKANEGRVAALNTTIRGHEQEIAQLKGEVARLTEFERRVNLLIAEYQNYVQTEDRILASKSQTAVLDGKLALEGFLTSAEVARIFPGLDKRIRTYDTAFQEAGRQSGLQDATDIVQTLSGFQDVAQQRAYLDAQVARVSNDPVLSDFLKALRRLVK